MIYKTKHIPVLRPQIGDVWTDEKTFKRVYSRGGAWENVNLGSKHPDEADHEQSNEPKAEQRHDSTQVSGGAGEPASGDGDDGKTVPESGVGAGPQDPVLTGPGIDANGSDVF